MHGPNNLKGPPVIELVLVRYGEGSCQSELGMRAVSGVLTVA